MLLLILVYTILPSVEWVDSYSNVHIIVIAVCKITSTVHTDAGLGLKIMQYSEGRK